MNDLTNEPLGDETFTEIDKQTGELVTYCVFTGEVVNRSSYPSDLATRYKYDPEMGDVISDKIREGMTLTDVAKLKGFPTTAVIYRWRRRYPDFARKLREAREDRAEYYADKMVATIEAATDKDDMKVAKEQAKVYQWQAERANPTDYAPKKEVKLEAEVKTVPMYVIETGIDRSPPVDETITDAVFREVTEDDISTEGDSNV